MISRFSIKEFLQKGLCADEIGNQKKWQIL